MTRALAFDPNGWEDYVYWQTQDRKTLKRINLLIADVLRDPFAGIGKPEPLKHILSGAWSRRVDEAHRLVYFVTDEQIRHSPSPRTLLTTDDPSQTKCRLIHGHRDAGLSQAAFAARAGIAAGSGAMWIC